MKAETPSARDYTGHNEYGLLDGWDNVRDNMRIGKRDIGQTSINEQ